MAWQLIHADCIEAMAAMDEASVDAIVCDPPYGLEFMGKEWDRFRTDDPGTTRHRGERARNHEIGTAPAPVKGNPWASERAGYGGAARPHTYRCTGCGKRDQFRNPHDCAGEWKRELLDPHAAPPSLLAYQEWSRAWATEALRVLKPGAHLLVFGGTRTFHRLACALEDAGFEIRDTLCWLYGSGFPKSLNLDGAWQGWGTALKPAFEPIVLARKPLVGSVATNVERFGTGALNIDGTRIGYEDGGDSATNPAERARRGSANHHGQGLWREAGDGLEMEPHSLGRWPANVVLDPEAAEMLDAQTGEIVPSARAAPRRLAVNPNLYEGGWGPQGPMGYTDRGGASRFYFVAKGENDGAAVDDGEPGSAPEGDAEVPAGDRLGEGLRFAYVPKADREERDRGLEGFAVKPLLWSSGTQSPGTFQAEGTIKEARNAHPTVKPVELMRWLVKLITPPGGLVLDPFTGSGSTGIAALREGFDFIGIEREADYVEIARARIQGDAPLFNIPAEVGVESTP